jgi:GTPase Era involved in 16S rRNA processing
VIKHLDGICHVYIDDQADLDKAVAIADNAKTQRYSPCNTMETLLVHQAVAVEVLPRLCRIYTDKGVELRGDEATRSILSKAGIGCIAATEQDWSTEYLAPILENLIGRKERKILVLNKVDGGPKEPLLIAAEELAPAGGFDEVFFVSALTGDGVAELKTRLANLMPEAAWHYPEDQVSDASERLLAAEITREQLYRQLHDELPYDSAVRPESYTPRKDGSVEIHQQIVIARDSQKGIVLGKGGSKLKAIGEAARTELAALLGVTVHLFLHVKVEENWAESREIYEEIGLDWVK